MLTVMEGKGLRAEGRGVSADALSSDRESGPELSR